MMPTNGTRSSSGKMTPFTAKFPCPICGGSDNDRRGQGKRCFGALSSDGNYAHCTREDLAFGLHIEPQSLTYAHRLNAPCNCGHSHGAQAMMALPDPRISPYLGKTNSELPHTAQSCLELNFSVQALLTAVWDYTDSIGQPYAAVGRFEGPKGKTYRPVHWSPAGWILGDPPGSWPLYHLSSLRDARQVLVLEGEKCTNLAVSIGFAATTSAHGSSAATKTDWTPLAGKSVAILPDHDLPGEAYASAVSDILLELGCTVRIVRLPGLDHAEDLEQWMDRQPSRFSDDLHDTLQNLIDTAEVLGPPRWATLADIRAVASSAEWTWPGWIPSRRPVAIGAHPKTGKTRTMLGLINSVYHGHVWPDGTPSKLPPGMPTIYLCSDGQQDELAEIATTMGLPDAALVLPTRSTDPYGITNLDDPQAIASIESCIADTRPWAVVIDSLTLATDRDLCQQTHMRHFGALFNGWCQKFDLNVFLLCHLSAEGYLLGRRISALVRTDLRLECPDKNHSERLILFMDSSIARKPEPLGVTITAETILFDHDPPRRTSGNGHSNYRAAAKPEAAMEWIVQKLTRTNDQLATCLLDNWNSEDSNQGTNATRSFWTARNNLVESNTITCDGGTGTGRPMILHLITNQPELVNPTDIEQVDWNSY